MSKKYKPNYTFSKILETSKKLLLEVLPVVPTAKKLLSISVSISEKGTPMFSTIRNADIRLDAWYWWFNFGRKSVIETAESTTFVVDNSGSTSNNNNVQKKSNTTEASSPIRRWIMKSVICKFLAEIGFQPVRQDIRRYKPWGDKPTSVVYTVFKIPGTDKVLAEPEFQVCRTLLFNSIKDYEESVLNGEVVTLARAKKLNHQKLQNGTYGPAREIWDIIYDAKRKGLLRRK